MTSYLDTPRLPVIDLSLFDLGDPWRDHVAAQIDWASSTFGVFYIVGHGVDAALIDTLMELSRKFFAQEAVVKSRIRSSATGAAGRGYFPVGAELTAGQPDFKEGIWFGAEPSEASLLLRAVPPSLAQNVFPNIPGFGDAVQEYMRALTGLGHKLMTTIARGLGVEDGYFVDRYTGSPRTRLGMFHYPARPADGTGAVQWGTVEHTDDGLLAIAKQDDVGGLQVKYGERWLEAPDVPGSLVCNVGDVMERLTDGRYISAVHRVRSQSGRSRLSMPFFFDPGFGAEIAPIRRIVHVDWQLHRDDQTSSRAIRER